MHQYKFGVAWCAEKISRIGSMSIPIGQPRRMVCTNPCIELHVIGLNKKRNLNEQPNCGDDEMIVPGFVRLAMNQTHHHQVKGRADDKSEGLRKIDQP